MGVGRQEAELPPLQTVVCGVDEGDSGRDVVLLAEELCDRLQARLVLVHVLPASGPGMATVEGAGDALRHAELQRAEQLLEALSPTAERRVEFGAPATELGRVASEENADLIVVGCRGRSALASALLGSISAHLARSATCPVLVLTPLARASAA